MILPPPVDGAVIVMPELPPRSRVLVAVGEPVNTVSRMAHHMQVEPAVIAKVPVDPVTSDAMPMGLLAVPVQVLALLNVMV